MDGQVLNTCLENKIYMKIQLIICSLVASVNVLISQEKIELAIAQVNFDDYEELVQEVKSIRQERLISFDEFLAFQKDENTIVLDTRSRKNYEAIHIKGAINLPFTEFTTQKLRHIIPDVNTRILIYCNNNIKGDPIYFGSKTYSLEDEKRRKEYYNKAIIVDKSHTMHNSKFISLALNIPTYINLYGYGYRNIYELNELVDIRDPRITFEKKAR